MTKPLDLDAIEKRAEAAEVLRTAAVAVDFSIDDPALRSYSIALAKSADDIPSLLARVKEQDIENFEFRSMNAQGQANVDELIERVRSLQGELRRMDEKNAKMASALKPFAALGFPDTPAANISLMRSWVDGARAALRRDGK